jgi:MraZ protein
VSSQEITFTGEYVHSIDSQRRVAVPRQWRVDGLKYYLLPGRDGVLQLVPEYYFKDFLDKVRKVSLTNAKVGRALALLGARAQECQCDKQGRISLTEKMKEYASLDAELVMVGAFTHAQIWNKQAWDKQAEETDDVLDVIDDLFSDGGSDLASLLKNLGGN